jgi:hypothetical protein
MVDILSVLILYIYRMEEGSSKYLSDSTSLRLEMNYRAIFHLVSCRHHAERILTAKQMSI